mmetsp:Transcript_49245/g.98452  ORF Transcript_49245/g.98452 Transcript_49245/m.98452 type:complete len:218 (-) Transcript_49245:34-687(-)
MVYSMPLSVAYFVTASSAAAHLSSLRNGLNFRRKLLSRCSTPARERNTTFFSPGMLPSTNSISGPSAGPSDARMAPAHTGISSLYCTFFGSVASRPSIGHFTRMSGLKPGGVCITGLKGDAVRHCSVHTPMRSNAPKTATLSPPSRAMTGDAVDTRDVRARFVVWTPTKALRAFACELTLDECLTLMSPGVAVRNECAGNGNTTRRTQRMRCAAMVC